MIEHRFVVLMTFGHANRTHASGLSVVRLWSVAEVGPPRDRADTERSLSYQQKRRVGDTGLEPVTSAV
jgi:hypothetical protein